jgi:hypothetical protein
MKRGVNFLIVIVFAFSGLFIVNVGDVYGKKKDGEPAAECAKMGGQWNGKVCRVLDVTGKWCNPGEIAVFKWAGKKMKLHKCAVYNGPKLGRRIIISQDSFWGSTKIFGGGEFSYEIQTCTGKCSISAVMTSQATVAKGNLPGKFKSGVYVKIVDGDGNPTMGSFNICLPTRGAKNSMVYKFIGGGEWRLVGGIVRDKKICTWAYSSGNYAVVDVGK